MKVAWVVPGGMDPGGTHRVIPCLLWLLRRVAARHETHVFAMRGAAGPGTYGLEGATIHDLGPRGRTTLRTLRAIMAEHRAGPFDLVHAFWASGPGVPAALAARLLRRPMLLHVTGGDLVAMPDIGYGGRKDSLGRARVRLALATADRVTVPSHPLRAAAEALGVRAERVPPGVDRCAWPPTTPRPRPGGRPGRLVHVASLNPVKDQETLLRAARRLADAGVAFTLDIAGGDTLGGRIQARAATLGLADRVRFHGFMIQDRLRELVAGADALVVSSRHEGDPVAMLEAAMAGVPTVGTRVGHLADWAPDAALAVNVGDAPALARAITELLADEPLRLRIATAAQRRALAEDADWSAARLLQIYRELADSRGSASSS